MVKCLCGSSTLELFRASGMLLPELTERPRTAKLEGCCLPDRISLSDDMDRLGVRRKPYHLAFCDRQAIHRRNDVICHLKTSPLPSRSLIRLSKETLTVGPELLFLELAGSGLYDDIELAEIGYELCGSYVLDTSWDGFTNIGTVTTTSKKIKRVLDASKGAHGIQQATRALRLVHNGSNSPMETILALLLCTPPRYGGMNLGPVQLNKRVMTSVGPRWVDLLFYQHNVGLEYKGKRVHSIEKSGRDDRRQNKLIGAGITIINVWYEDIASDLLFQDLINDILKALHVRPQRRGATFAANQRLLRAQLLPAFKLYGSLE